MINKISLLASLKFVVKQRKKIIKGNICIFISHDLSPKAHINYFISFSQQFYEVGAISASILKITRLEPRKFE